MDTTAPQKILITGSTGNTGTLLIDALQDRSVHVHAMIRRPEDETKLAGWVRPVVANFDDADSIRAALADVDAAYLVTPSSERAESQQLHFVDLAAEAGIERLVLLSQYASAADSPVRFLRYHAAVENHIVELGLNYTFLRPNLYLQSLTAFAPMITATSTLAAPIGDARVSVVDVRDIAAVAAAALTESGHAGRTYTLTGPSAVTHAEIAAALSDVTGLDIKFADTSPEQFAQALQGFAPPWQLDGLLEDYAHYRRGEAATVSTDIADVLGRPAIDVATFARDYADAFTGAASAAKTQS